MMQTKAIAAVSAGALALVIVALAISPSGPAPFELLETTDGDTVKTQLYKSGEPVSHGASRRSRCF